ncbi:uncharacterized protein AMSG_06541 [Thecamonas trahens ATCC 50062]|uniref:1-phosphatidylinositol-3-phosphate 5-kinase n=1 Tax=Thecamonas trahens ATCC 50062 TaxID=461836 RepID=A0A0L0DG82_THETB|nr:hypothetical protein AMSG_06541 [Thecamonas trahens ATCC 50062]KNC51190.1 hypothetical protein AMSG_06541 [Thecamonas trahens ATCC 50062]|eukprot:XP_013756391.1 hypothetical protein AMSG_06541 [Thecamonas trahens ATCC 50062]
MHALAWIAVALLVVSILAVVLLVAGSKWCGQSEEQGDGASETTALLSSHGSRISVNGYQTAVGSLSNGDVDDNGPGSALPPPAISGDGVRILSKEFWIPDAAAPACAECAALFNFIRRRHHCRLCGLVFCASCSQYRLDGALFGRVDLQRTCKPCHDSFLEARAASRLIARTPDADNDRSCADSDARDLVPAGDGRESDGDPAAGVGASAEAATSRRLARASSGVLEPMQPQAGGGSAVSFHIPAGTRRESGGALVAGPLRALESALAAAADGAGSRRIRSIAAQQRSRGMRTESQTRIIGMLSPMSSSRKHARIHSVHPRSVDNETEKADAHRVGRASAKPRAGGVDSPQVSDIEPVSESETDSETGCSPTSSLRRKQARIRASLNFEGPSSVNHVSSDSSGSSRHCEGEESDDGEADGDETVIDRNEASSATARRLATALNVSNMDLISAMDLASAALAEDINDLDEVWNSTTAADADMGGASQSSSKRSSFRAGAMHTFSGRDFAALGFNRHKHKPATKLANSGSDSGSDSDSSVLLSSRDDVPSLGVETASMMRSASLTALPRPEQVDDARAPQHACARAQVLEELTHTYDAYSGLVLQEALAVERLPALWEKPLAELGREAAAHVAPSAMPGDELDVRAYIHQEYVAGGEVRESRVILGSVTFKRVAHKKMATSIGHPRILLLAGSLEHERQGASSMLTNFDTLLVQEREFLRLQVAKIMDVNPQVVVVAGSVSRLALDFLLKAGVTLIPSAGLHLCVRLARQTGATVLTSVDAIRANPGVLGSCVRFRSEVLSTPGGGRKHMLVFDGTPPSLGVTLLLRGRAPPGWLPRIGPSSFEAVLDALVQLSVFSSMHALLEASLLADEGAVYAESYGLWLAERAQLSGRPFSREWTEWVDCGRRAAGYAELGPNAVAYSRSFARRHLSLTPGVYLNPRYTDEYPEAAHISPVDGGREVENGGQAVAAAAVAAAVGAAGVGLGSDGANGEISLASRTLSTHNLNSGSQRGAEVEVLRLTSDLVPSPQASRRSSRTGEGENDEGNLCVASAFEYQDLRVLFTTASMYKPEPCCIPHAQVLEFYQGSDMTLGQYVEVCFDLSNTCRQVNCQRDMLAHVCTYAHAGGAVHVRVARLEEPLPGVGDDELVMWSACQVCEEVTAVRPVSGATWMLSFGKYLEATFYPVPVAVRGGCEHPVHSDHVRLFACGGLVLSFEYEPLRLLSVAGPNRQLKFEAHTSYALLNAERASLLARMQEAEHAGHMEDGPDAQELVARAEAAASRAEVSAVYRELASGVALAAGSDESEVLAVWQLEHVHFGLEPVMRRYAPYPVVDDEPTSLIGYLLASQGYADQMRQVGVEVDPERIESGAMGEAEHRELLMAAPSFRAELEFGSRGFQFSVKAFYAAPFHALRAKYCGGQDNVLASLARCVKWAATGGKTDSEFLKTLDDRLILKEVQKVEMGAFLEFAPSYFEYMMRVLYDDVPSLLVKFLGLYKVEIRSRESGVKYRKYVVLMENLFYGKSIDKVFDLKGSERSRYVKSKAPDQVLMDENFLEYIWQSPLYVREYSKVYLYSAVCNDSLLLASLKVMDYSLLLGIDYTTGELTVGIIDYIRQYTWDKHLESWVKSTGILGGGGKRPTVISPHQYKERFRRAINRYFVVVPDKHTR